MGIVNIAGYLVYICFFVLSVRASAGALAFLMTVNEYRQRMHAGRNREKTE